MHVQKLTTAADFWAQMVIPDYETYQTRPADLRAAFHAAISLFHLADWVFHTHSAAVQAVFTFADRNGVTRPASMEFEFATALEQQNADFGRIRGIANAAKHLRLINVRPVPNAPSHAANTQVRVVGGYFGNDFGNYFGRYFGRTIKIVLEGPSGQDMDFALIASSVYQMWMSLNQNHHWW